jgi:hypothetical protein
MTVRLITWRSQVQILPPQPPLPNSDTAPSSRSRAGGELQHARDLADQLDAKAVLIDAHLNPLDRAGSRALRSGLSCR